MVIRWCRAAWSLPPISLRTGRQEVLVPISHSRGDRHRGRATRRVIAPTSSGASGRRKDVAAERAATDRAPKGRPGPGKRTTQSGDASLTSGQQPAIAPKGRVQDRHEVCSMPSQQPQPPTIINTTTTNQHPQPQSTTTITNHNQYHNHIIGKSEQSRL